MKTEETDRESTPKAKFTRMALDESRQKLPDHPTEGMAVSISGDGYTAHWQYLSGFWDWHHVDYD